MRGSIVLNRLEFLAATHLFQVALGGRVLFVGNRGVLRDLAIILRLPAVQNEEVDLVDKHDKTDNKAEADAGELEVDWTEDCGHSCARGAAHHAAVVQRDKETDELGQMADIGPVVVISLRIWQVDEIVEKERQRKSNDDKSRHGVFVHRGNVESNSSPVHYSHHEVQPLHETRLELLLILPKAFVLGAHQSQGHQNWQDNRKHSSNSARSVQAIIFWRVGEVDACRVCEVEAVEENESEKHLLYDPFGYRMQRRGAFLAETGQEVEQKGYYDDRHHYGKHYVAVSEEVGLVANRLHPSRSVRAGLQQATLGLLLSQVHGVPVNAFHAHQGRHQGVDIVHITNIEMRHLQDTEQLQAYNLARQHRKGQSAITGVLYSSGYTLQSLLIFAD